MALADHKDHVSVSSSGSGPYHYRVQLEDPEGILMTLDITHDRHYTQEEFQDIAEAAILRTMRIRKSGEKECFTSSILSEELERVGFRGVVSAAFYTLDTICPDEEGIRNAELREELRKDWGVL